MGRLFSVAPPCNGRHYERVPFTFFAQNKRRASQNVFYFDHDDKQRLQKVILMKNYWKKRFIGRVGAFKV